MKYIFQNSLPSKLYLTLHDNKNIIHSQNDASGKKMWYKILEEESIPVQVLPELASLLAVITLAGSKICNN